MRRRTKRPTITAIAVAVFCALSAGRHAEAQYTPVWFDGFDSAIGTDINVNADAPRQGGSPVPLAYNANVSFAAANQAADYHQQIVGDGVDPDNRLLLAGDVNITGSLPQHMNFHAYASPNHNFNGSVGSQVIGKKISVEMDAFTNAGDYMAGDPNNPNDGYFVYSALTIGSSEQLSDSNNKTSGFSVIFIEQTFADSLWTDPSIGTAFIQIRDDRTTPSDPLPMPDGTVGNLIPNPAGTGPGLLELFIDDPTDGSPWDGVGQTDIDVVVNGTTVFNYSKLGGGFTDNFITLEGSNQKNVGLPSILGVHNFNNLTVFSGAIPEPSSLLLLGVGLGAAAIRIRRLA